jgi:hypothetical protein
MCNEGKGWPYIINEEINKQFSIYIYIHTVCVCTQMFPNRNTKQ